MKNILILALFLFAFEEVVYASEACYSLFSSNHMQKVTVSGVRTNLKDMLDEVSISNESFEVIKNGKTRAYISSFSQNIKGYRSILKMHELDKFGSTVPGEYIGIPIGELRANFSLALEFVRFNDVAIVPLRHGKPSGVLYFSSMFAMKEKTITTSILRSKFSETLKEVRQNNQKYKVVRNGRVQGYLEKVTESMPFEAADFTNLSSEPSRFKGKVVGISVSELRRDLSFMLELIRSHEIQVVPLRHNKPQAILYFEN